MQRVKTKSLLYLEHDDTCRVYDVTNDHLQAKVILFTLCTFSPKRGTLANSEGRDELPQA